jgi:hypothetical protein
MRDEPDSTKELTNRAVKILDAKYEKADLPKIVETQCRHLDAHQRKELLDLLLEFEDLFDGTLGIWDTEPVHLELKDDAKLYHGKPYPVPKAHKETLMKEIQRMCDIGILLAWQPELEWASPTFCQPKKDQTIRVLNDLRLTQRGL